MKKMFLSLFFLLCFVTSGYCVNLSSYFSNGTFVGQVLSLPYNGPYFTAIDGSVWLATNGYALPYSSAYSGLLTNAPYLVTSAYNLNGPNSNNFWDGYSALDIVGANTGGATWLMMGNVETTWDYYYISSNGGSSWTQESPPVAAKNWISMWDGTNFVAYALGTTTNGVQVSTNGTSWTGYTAISLSTIKDAMYANGNYLVLGTSVCAYTTNPNSWSSSSLGFTPSGVATTPQTGYMTYNVGAGLFIVGSTDGGPSHYYTSPTGATWTARSSLVFPSSTLFSNVIWVSDNVTTTLAIGLGGEVQLSTNGTTWTNEGFIDHNLNTTAPPTAAYWDGTYFNVNFNGVIYYSTNGTSWTRATTGNLISGTTYMSPAGLYVLSGQYAVLQPSPSSSGVYTSVIYPTYTADTQIRNYVRIL